MRKLLFALLAVSILLSQLSMAQATSVSILPRTSQTNPGVTIKTQYGYANVTANAVLAGFNVYPNGTVLFNVAGFEKIQRIYYFTVFPFGNGTLSLLFSGIPPLQLKGNGFTSAYNFDKSREELGFSSAGTDPIQVIYAEVGPDIGNAITKASAILGILIIAAMIGFSMIIIAIVSRRGLPLNRVILYGIAVLFIAVMALVILIVLGLFIPVFNGLGL